MLKYSFNQLADKNEQLTQVDEMMTFGPEFYERGQELITEVKSAHVTGQLVYDAPFVIAQLHVVTDIIAPSSRSLAPVELKQDFKFLEGYTKEQPSAEDAEAIDPIIELEDDEIDLQTAVEDNILLNIPMVVLTEAEKEKNEMPKGQDWEVISQTEYQERAQETSVNPEFAKLKDLFDKEDK